MKNFLTRRWRGEVPLETVFWRDMIVIGTVINVLTTAASMALFAFDFPAGLALLVFFAPLPLNLFLFLAVWKASPSAGEGAWMFQGGALVWLVAVTLL